MVVHIPTKSHQKPPMRTKNIIVKKMNNRILVQSNTSCLESSCQDSSRVASMGLEILITGVAFLKMKNPTK